MLSIPMPDVTSDVASASPATLQWVGMEQIAVPISMTLQDDTLQQLSAKANVFVSLEKPEAKGIHMSRLHLALNKLADRECNQASIDDLLEEMVNSQEGISQNAKIELSFDLLLRKPALLSGEIGFQTYPVVLRAERHEAQLSCELEVTIPYSSTCPCSAALARQLYANAINQQFPDSTVEKGELMEWVQSQAGSVATPHSQRSYAYIKMVLGTNEWPHLPSLVVELEQLIGTPVQTAVKRSDEQEFARLNAENLMFCEDAAKRVKLGLEGMESVTDYWLKIQHRESLHAHDAVAVDQKFR